MAACPARASPLKSWFWATRPFSLSASVAPVLVGSALALALTPGALAQQRIGFVDSSVILEYLDEVFPAVLLTPTDPVRRAHMRKWLRFFEEVPTPAVRYPTFDKVLINGFRKLSPEAFEKAANSRPLRKHFYKRMGQDGFSEEDMEKAVDDIRTTVARMEAALAVAGPWLMGTDYTLADICVTPSIDRMEDLGFEALWEENHPHVTAWFERMKARPAFQTAYYKGARMSDIYPDLGLGRSSPAAA